MSLQTLKVLAVMMERPDSDYYGLELIDGTGIKSGTLYPVLLRLESHGWLESDWENIDQKKEGRRARRYYRLTQQGRARAKEELTEVQKALAGNLGWST